MLENSDSLTRVKEILGNTYEIQRVLGKGGMATVFLAKQKSLNRLVALKVVHSNLVHDEEFVNRFIREAQVCASLNHRNIVMIYDVGSIGPIHFMAMEYLQGLTLRDLIRTKGVLSPEQVVNYIAPVAEALNYIHNKGIIHRDVKSSNILITDDGRAVLMDFGIVFSEDKDPLSHDGSVLGTPEYMSPEQAEGKIKIDGRSDLYSLGVIMYESLSGTVPFRSDNYITTIHQVIHDSPVTISKVNPKVPKWLSSIVMSCLIKDRDTRMQTGHRLAKALRTSETIVIDTGDRTRKIHKPPEPLPVEPRSFLFLKMLIAIVFLIVVVLSFFAIQQTRNKIKIIPPKNDSFPISKPGSANSLILKGNDFISQNKPDSAIIYYNNSKQLYGSTPDLERMIEIAGNLINENNNRNIKPRNDSLKLESAEVKPVDNEPQIKKFLIEGDQMVQRKDYSGAIDSYNKALTLSPGRKEITDKIINAGNLREREDARLAAEARQKADVLQKEEARKAAEARQKADALQKEEARKEAEAKQKADAMQKEEVRKEVEANQRKYMQELGIEMVLIRNGPGGNFYISKSEITKKAWRQVMGNSPGEFQGDDLPVESISWNEVQQFIQSLNKKSGMNYRLPTSGEWEFAASGGQTSNKYSGSNIISEVGWYESNSGGKTNPVMQLSPNSYGLYDMSGNVWEFCSNHSLKGGSWISPNSQCSIVNTGNPNDNGDYTIGFRICRSPD